MWKTHSEDDGERVYDQTNDKVGERKPYIFVLVCAALEEINQPRDIIFPERAAAHRYCN
jgi:hypothetical protein